MAVHRIFAEKDATIYSRYPDKNTGIDEILDVSLFKNTANVRGEVSRALIKFPQSEINDVLNNLVSGSPYSASIKIYLAEASEIPLDYKIFAYPASGSWNMGTGREANIPSSSNGVSWKYRENNNIVTEWTTSSFPVLTTGSYDANPGGGVWYTGSLYESTQSFTYITSKDININVTTAVNAHYSGTIINEGFLFKHSSSLEFNYTQSFNLKYFSTDTHTIYPPVLEVKWSDFTYSTASGASVVSNDQIVVNIPIKKSYDEDQVEKFRINVRDQYPTRTFQTSSLYLTNKLLPTTSYWAIKDMDINEYIIGFDEVFTKLSADTTGNYFTCYMNTLQPERYYKIIIKTIINGETLVIDNDNIFKVTK